MIFGKILKNKSFLVYGLSLTGLSVVKFLKKANAKKIFLWDDNIKQRRKYNLKLNDNSIKNKFSEVDYIILSPGISLGKSKKKNSFLKIKIR